MVDQALPSNAASPIRLLARWIGPFFAFGLLVGLGYALGATAATREELRGTLTDLVRHGLGSGNLADLPETIGAGIELLALVTGQGLIVIVVLLAIEMALVGPPRRWSTVRLALGLQAMVVLFYFLAGPLIGRLLPWELGTGPLLIISGRAMPAFLQPVFPMLGAVLLILFITFGSYWSHRALHRFPILWRFHAVHHSVEDMDAANSYVHPVDVLVERTFLIALGVLLKVDFETFIWAAAFTAFYDRLIHSRGPINFGFMRHVLVDNRHHFIHHSLDPADYDRNFGTYFTLWDRLFGTYLHPESDELRPTGLTDRRPPTTVWQFATGQLDPRPSIQG